MKRCTVFRGSNSLRGLSTTTKDPVVKLLERWKPIRTPHEESTTRRTSEVARPELPPNNESVRGADSGEVEEVASGFWRDDASVETTGDAEVVDCRIFPVQDGTEPVLDQIQPPAFPISPFMDPSFRQAREKHRAPKEPPPKVLTQLQQELAKNPFALALATPVRRCGLTSMVLPRYFLQEFKVLSHPETGKPHFLPASLAQKHPKQNDPPRDKRSSIEGTTGYSLATRQLFASMESPSGGYFSIRGGMKQRAHHQLVPRGWKTVKPAMKMLMSATWRPDMGDWIMELMRRRCMEHLVNLAKLKRGYLVGCVDWEDAANKPSVAAFLWTGGMKEDLKDAPADFSTLDLGMEGGLKGGEKRRKRKVPVYNLRTLLGQEKLAELREVGNGMFTREMVALKNKKMTLELQSKLWKLQGYVADYHKLAQARKDMLGGTEPGEEDDDFAEDEEAGDEDDY